MSMAIKFLLAIQSITHQQFKAKKKSKICVKMLDSFGQVFYNFLMATLE